MLPTIGTVVRVVCKNHNFGFVGWQPETSTYQGTLIEKFHWCSSDEFCMTTGLVRFPIRTIKMNEVIRIEDPSGKTLLTSKPSQPILTPNEWRVKGSKGDTYVVSRNGNIWSCTCIHSQFRRSDCKHIKETKEKNGL